MSNEFTEKFGQQMAAFYNCVSKPMMDLAALNVKTFNSNIAKATSHASEIANAKKPEDFMSVQMKLANETGELGLKYIQDVMSIVTDASSDLTNLSKRCATMATEAAANTNAFANVAANFKNQSNKAEK